MMKIFEVKINRDAYQYHKERLRLWELNLQK